MLYPFLRDWYGQLAGYGRRGIRRAAAGHSWWSAERLAALTDGLFRARVLDAIQRFPAYAARVRAHAGRVPEGPDDVRLEALPVWTREDQNRLFEDKGWRPLPGAIAHATGGSTGMPMRFHLTRESYEWRAAVSDRGYAWAGAEPGRRAFFVWGAPAVSLSLGARLKADVEHRLQRRAFFDSFLFDDRRKIECCRRIGKFRPEAIVGYAGNLVELALFVEANPAALRWRARSVVTAAEGLQSGQRELLERFLGREVFMSYGSREFMLIGMECGRRRGYHVASDNLLVETVDERGRPAPPGVTGRILVTDLRNAAAPFIRYEIGDLGAIARQSCDCGLPFPLLERVDGRSQEVIRAPNGDRVTALVVPHLMKEFWWIRGYQIAQSSDRSIEARLIARQELTPDFVGPLERALRSKLGPDLEMSFVRVARLAKNAAGKTPIVVGVGTEATNGTKLG
ncbi:MAG: hypothetical protein QME60_03430 [Verrucomicrobiota bacterium]|nr:hypothetical protein [Verrucomicrobiota bacterium]